jgi:hypothetical protein
MTAKEKAKELVQRFSKLEKGLNEEEWKGREVSFEGVNRQSALICVDEMLEEILSTPNVYELDTYYYWKKVKQEINKL